MTLSRTYAQLKQNGWQADIGEIDDVPHVYFSVDGQEDIPTPGLGLQLRADLMADLASSVTNPDVDQAVFVTRFREDRLVQLPGHDPIPADADTNARYEISYASDFGVPILSVKEADFPGFAMIATAARDFDFESAPGNYWDATVSPSLAQFGFYPGLRIPDEPRAIPGFW